MKTRLSQVDFFVDPFAVSRVNTGQYENGPTGLHLCPDRLPQPGRRAGVVNRVITRHRVIIIRKP